MATKLTTTMMAAARSAPANAETAVEVGDEQHRRVTSQMMRSSTTRLM